MDPGAAPASGSPRILLSSAALPDFGLDRFFAIAARAGFDGVELVEGVQKDMRHPGYIRDLSSRYELPVLVLRAPHSSAGTASVQTSALDQKIRASLLLAEALSVRIFVIDPAAWNEAPFMRWLQSGYLPLQAQTSVQMAIENLPLIRTRHKFLPLLLTAANRLHTVRQVGVFPALAANLAHFQSAGESLTHVWQAHGKRIRHVYLPAQSLEPPNRAPERDDGQLPIPRFLRLLLQERFRGTLTYLYSMPSSRQVDEGMLSDGLQRALYYYRKLARSRRQDT